MNYSNSILKETLKYVEISSFIQIYVITCIQIQFFGQLGKNMQIHDITQPFCRNLKMKQTFVYNDILIKIMNCVEPRQLICYPANDKDVL